MNELFPSAIMFGMSSIEFWEDEPQLYWAYRFSYIKKLEMEQQLETEKMQRSCWLQGAMNKVAYEVALNNAFSKNKVEYPSYENMFKEVKYKNSKVYKDLEKKLENVDEPNIRQQIEFNYWARI